MLRTHTNGRTSHSSASRYGAVLALLTACGSAMAGPPVTTILDTTSNGAIDNGSIDPSEYGSLSYFYTGAGTGFNGCVGNSTLYMDSDATYLYLGHAIGAAYDGNYAVVFLDTRPGGFTDAQMNDQGDGGRNVASNLCYLADDAFDPEFEPDFAVVMGDFGTVTFELSAGNAPGYLSVVDFQVPPAFGQREYRLPLSALGITSGVQSNVDFFMALISETAYASNESIPAYAPLQNNGNPGFGDGTNGGTVGTPGYGAYNRFITQGQSCPPSLGATFPFTNLYAQQEQGHFANSVVTFNFNYPGDINAIRLSGSYSTYGASWRSDMRLRFVSPNNVAYEFYTSTNNSPGTVTFNNAVAQLGQLESGTGTWTLEVFDIFNDEPFGPDAVWTRMCLGADAITTAPIITSLFAAPAQAGSTSGVFVDVRPGNFPQSTFTGAVHAVTVNASAIGGGTVVCRDDGVAPDVTANDLTFTGQVMPAVGTTPGRYTLTASVFDDQGRSSQSTVYDAIVAPSCPSGTSTLSAETSYVSGPLGTSGNGVLSGSFGSSGVVTSLRVSGYATPFAPALASRLRIRATAPSGGVYTIDPGFAATSDDAFIEDLLVPLSTLESASGTWQFETYTLDGNDDESRWWHLCVAASPTILPQATGSASPASVLPNGTDVVRYTISVTPGDSPASTGLFVRVDESSFGGSPTRPIFDDGVYPDQIAGDSVFTGEVTIPVGTPPQTLSLPYIVGDAQGRTAQGSPNLTFQVRDPFEEASINGIADFGEYHGPIWVQNTPTRFGDNIAQAGSPTGNPASVTTGIELAIPLSQIGAPVSIPGGWNFKLGGFLSNWDQSFISNQFIGALPPNTACLMEPRGISLSGFAGDQFITVTPAYRPLPPTIDGTLDGAGYYGSSQFTQSTYSCFGDSTKGELTNADGSEIDGVYAVISNGPSGDTLYLFVTGNLWDGNRLNLFFDTIAGEGQQRLLYNNSYNPYGLWARMAEWSGQEATFTFDNGFAPDYSLTLNAYATQDTPLESQMHWTTLPTSDGDVPLTNFIGRTWNSTPGGGFIDGDSSFSGGYALAIDNSNAEGIPGKPILLPTPQRDYAFGSEIDGVWSRVDQDNGKLRLLITGNIESGFQKLDLFFDVRAGGQNVLAFDNPLIANGGLPTLAGLTFDPAFAADYYVSVNTGHTPIRVWADAAPIRNECLICDPATFDGLYGVNWDFAAWNGGDKIANDPIQFPATSGTFDPYMATTYYTDGAPRLTRDNWYGSGGLFADLIEVAIDNSNVAGVGDGNTGGGVGNPAAVTTGIELEIDLGELGWDGGPIRLAGWVNGYSHGRVSNQVIGGLPPIDNDWHPNLGMPGMINFGSIAGNQFIDVPLEPVGPNCNPCPADYNMDGGVDGGDLLAFFHDYEAGEFECADTNFDGGIDGNDLTTFFGAYEAGGC